MNILKIPILISLAMLFMAAPMGTNIVAAAENLSSAPVVSLKEMPLLRGDTWLKMSHDEKIAFVWGMGHIITMERERTEQYPELKKLSFASKMADGLAGMPMDEVVNHVDRYYKDSPDKVTDPVVKALWVSAIQSKEMAGEATPQGGK
ncbi:MAG: hypothetical protein AB9919_08190 [Geobacteraceae bacterium]